MRNHPRSPRLRRLAPGRVGRESLRGVTGPPIPDGVTCLIALSAWGRLAGEWRPPRRSTSRLRGHRQRAMTLASYPFRIERLSPLQTTKAAESPSVVETRRAFTWLPLPDGFECRRHRSDRPVVLTPIDEAAAYRVAVPDGGEAVGRSSRSRSSRLAVADRQASDRQAALEPIDRPPSSRSTGRRRADRPAAVELIGRSQPPIDGRLRAESTVGSIRRSSGTTRAVLAFADSPRGESVRGDPFLRGVTGLPIPDGVATRLVAPTGCVEPRPRRVRRRLRAIDSSPSSRSPISRADRRSRPHADRPIANGHRLVALEPIADKESRSPSRFTPTDEGRRRYGIAHSAAR